MHVFTSSFKVDVTPTLPCSVAGYGELKNTVQVIFSRLEANVLIFESKNQTWALVQVDSLYVSSELRDMIERRVGLRVLIVASHTHGAPFLDSHKTRLGVFNSGYLDFVAEKISNGILNHKNLGQTEVNFGESDSRVAVFRRKKAFGFFSRKPFVCNKVALLPNADVEIDRRVSCFSFLRDGKVVAVLWRFTCHPVTTPNKRAISADFPGEIREYIRKKYANNNLPVLFLQGPTGDVRPHFTGNGGSVGLMRRMRFPFQKSFFSYPTEKQFRNFRDELFQSVNKALESAEPLAVADIHFSYRRHNVKNLERISGPPVEIPIGVLTGFGDKVFLFVGAEISSQYREKLEDAWRDKVLICGYFEDVFGYLPTNEQRVEGGYEGRDFISLFDLKGDFSKDFESQFLGEVREMIENAN